MRAILREPLVQFLAIGAVVVALAQVFDGPSVPTVPGDARVIRLDAAQVAQLETLAARTWQRQPTADELTRLIDATVREEALAREARALGLAEDDTVIRQRLAQKMEFLLEPPADAITADDAALQAHLAANMARYRPEPRIALRQIFLSPETHGAALADDAAAIRAALANGADPAALTDPTLLPLEVGETALGNVRRVFGPDFARSVMALPQDVWSEPVESPYGVHLVHIDSRDIPAEPTLADVREAVERDYLLDRRQAAVDAAIDEIVARFTVEIERPVERPQ
ncbi:MAG: peptidylprolyl isomerase [Acuticoccus sp.]